MFRSLDLGNLKQIEGLNTSMNINFSKMFANSNLSNLEHLELNTESGYTFEGMFNATIFPSDRSIVNISEFDTHNTTILKDMFSNTDYIHTKDFSK